MVGRTTRMMVKQLAVLEAETFRWAERVRGWRAPLGTAHPELAALWLETETALEQQAAMVSSLRTALSAGERRVVEAWALEVQASTRRIVALTEQGIVLAAHLGVVTEQQPVDPLLAPD